MIKSGQVYLFSIDRNLKENIGYQISFHSETTSSLAPQVSCYSLTRSRFFVARIELNSAATLSGMITVFQLYLILNITEKTKIRELDLQTVVVNNILNFVIIFNLKITSDLTALNNITLGNISKIQFHILSFICFDLLCFTKITTLLEVEQNFPKAEVVRRFTGLGYKKRSVYRWLDSDWKAKNFKQFENKIRTCPSNMDPKLRL
ncbi:hypothetical protein BpHYR1_013835 [Brachionus plicatilis]|uniref:Uncharacterized protein n=1 Tax=Brachionus plicatilis TaxID=10195 RepID=A0A3M7QCD6_BRAPC|nr:hypothetical protein BpHYR1_013835 [Brachionus plicatilis]